MRYTLALLVLLAFPAWADPSGLVSRVVDGDTFDVAGVRVRLHGIDAPERKTPEGKAATAHLKRLIEDRHIECDDTGQRSYKRVVAVCFLEGDDIAAAMVKSGHACDWPRYSGGAYDSLQTARFCPLKR